MASDEQEFIYIRNRDLWYSVFDADNHLNETQGHAARARAVADGRLAGAAHRQRSVKA